MPDFEKEIQEQNQRARDDYLERISCFTQEQLNDLVGSEKVANWLERREIFSLESEKNVLYPRFQFSDRKPHPTVGKVMLQFPRDTNSWQVALWFDAQNGWLDGKTPQEQLGMEKALVRAAKYFLDVPIG